MRGLLLPWHHCVFSVCSHPRPRVHRRPSFFNPPNSSVPVLISPNPLRPRRYHLFPFLLPSNSSYAVFLPRLYFLTFPSRLSLPLSTATFPFPVLYFFSTPPAVLLPHFSSPLNLFLFPSTASLPPRLSHPPAPRQSHGNSCVLWVYTFTQ